MWKTDWTVKTFTNFGKPKSKPMRPMSQFDITSPPHPACVRSLGKCACPCPRWRIIWVIDTASQYVSKSPVEIVICHTCDKSFCCYGDYAQEIISKHKCRIWIASSSYPPCRNWLDHENWFCSASVRHKQHSYQFHAGCFHHNEK